jgi:hypothetical protein
MSGYKRGDHIDQNTHGIHPLFARGILKTKMERGGAACGLEDA